MDKTIERRQTRAKELLLSQLAKMPNIQITCEKVGVSRATYYRWRQDHKSFAESADLAIEEGTRLINDLAEGQLLALIKEKHPTGIFYWLNHKHPAYQQRLEISTANTKDNLTEEELNELVRLLYSPSTFRQGQELLTSYVFRGLINDKTALLVLRMFVSQMRAEDIMARKAEAEVMTEVMIRKGKKVKTKKKPNG